MSSDGAKAFIARWAAVSASERANSQPFLCELCDLLGVARPELTRETGYACEYDVGADLSHDFTFDLGQTRTRNGFGYGFHVMKGLAYFAFLPVEEP